MASLGEKIQEIAERFQVADVYVFGSRAKETAARFRPGTEADPFLALEVIRGELLYAEDLDRQARDELYVLRRAGDLLPFKRQRLRLILGIGEE